MEKWIRRLLDVEFVSYLCDVHFRPSGPGRQSTPSAPRQPRDDRDREQQHQPPPSRAARLADNVVPRDTTL